LLIYDIMIVYDVHAYDGSFIKVDEADEAMSSKLITINLQYK